MTNADGKTPSPQGGFPAKATGEHRRKITHEVMPSGVVARVGTNTKHSRYLEQGTKHMEPRPWMFLTNSQMRGTINRILTRKIK
jgi:HK97 gp10 family phage protein